MAGMTKYVQESVLNWIKGNTFPIAPGAVFIGLFTTAPSDDASSGTEVSGGSYARVAATWGAISGVDASQIQNNNMVTFPVATADWGTVVAFGVFDALTGGNRLMGNNIAAITINSGRQAVFSATSLTLTVS